MRNLALHSDQIEGETKLDETILALISSKTPKIGYIPSQSDKQRKYYKINLDWYGQFGIKHFVYFDVDEEYDETLLDSLFSCDAIHLSGGNTYYFLNSLRKRGLLPKLKEYVEKGGILIGVSAGSIIMSDTIEVTTIDDDIGGDQNTIGITDFTALGLIDFDFFPHFDENPEVTRRLQEYSIRAKKVVYACKDGEGIVVNGENIVFIGDVKKIDKGQITIL